MNKKKLKKYGRKIKKFWKWTLVYKFCSLFPVNKKTILFETNLGNRIDGNPLYIYNYIKDLEEFRDFKFIWVDNQEYHMLENVTYIKKNSFQYAYTLPTVGYVISNLRIGNKFKKREGQKYIQTWHGTPLKRLVHDMVDFKLSKFSKENYLKFFDRDVSKWDLLLSPNKYSTEKFRQAFKYDGDVIEGYPRNYPLTLKYTSEYLDTLKEKVGIKDKSAKIYLYTPTFRDTTYNKKTKTYQHELKIDLDFLGSQKDKIFLIRTHYLVFENLDFSKYDNIVNVSEYNIINDLYLISDVLITDYSSTMFDYSYLNKPVILYAYDIDQYENEDRGFYFDYNSLSSNICYTEEQLYNIINDNSEQQLLLNFNEEIDMQKIISEIFDL